MLLSTNRKVRMRTYPTAITSSALRSVMKFEAIVPITTSNSYTQKPLFKHIRLEDRYEAFKLTQFNTFYNFSTIVI